MQKARNKDQKCPVVFVLDTSSSMTGKPIDELNKALPTVLNMDRQRKLDQRIEKYLQKLRKVDEVAFHLYKNHPMQHLDL